MAHFWSYWQACEKEERELNKLNKLACQMHELSLARTLPGPEYTEVTPAPTASSHRTLSAPAAPTWQPPYTCPICVFCTQPGHQLCECDILDEYLYNGLVNWKNNWFCLPDGAIVMA